MSLSFGAPPSLPPELWHLVLSPRLLSQADSRGVPRVCRSWFWPGQALLWTRVSVEIGSWRTDAILDALLDQPRFRDSLLETLTIVLKNTAVDVYKEHRRFDALFELDELLPRLPPLRSVALAVDDGSTGDIWEMLNLVLTAPCSAGVHLLHLSATSVVWPGSANRLACLHKLDRKTSLQTLELQVETLNPIHGNFHLATALLLTSLSLARGSLNLASSKCARQRCADAGSRARSGEPSCSSESSVRTVMGARMVAGTTFVRALIVLGWTHSKQIAAVEREARSAAIFALLPRLFALHLRLQTLALSPLVGLDALCSRESIAPTPPFWSTLPPSLERLALQAHLSHQPTPVLDFLRPGRAPKLRALQVAASSGRALSLMGAEFGVQVGGVPSAEICHWNNSNPGSSQMWRNS